MCEITQSHYHKSHDFDIGAYPWIPFFGGLLLNWRVCLCLNLGGPLRGVAGPPETRVADLISVLGSSRFMAVGHCWSLLFVFTLRDVVLM